MCLGGLRRKLARARFENDQGLCRQERAAGCVGEALRVTDCLGHDHDDPRSWIRDEVVDDIGEGDLRLVAGCGKKADGDPLQLRELEDLGGSRPALADEADAAVRQEPAPRQNRSDRRARCDVCKAEAIGPQKANAERGGPLDECVLGAGSLRPGLAVARGQDNGRRNTRFCHVRQRIRNAGQRHTQVRRVHRRADCAAAGKTGPAEHRSAAAVDGVSSALKSVGLHALAHDDGPGGFLRSTYDRDRARREQRRQRVLAGVVHHDHSQTSDNDTIICIIRPSCTCLPAVPAHAKADRRLGRHLPRVLGICRAKARGGERGAERHPENASVRSTADV